MRLLPGEERVNREAADYSSKLARCSPQEGHPFLVPLRPSSEALLRARAPGARDQHGCPSLTFPSFPIERRIHARRLCNGCNPIRQ